MNCTHTNKLTRHRLSRGAISCVVLLAASNNAGPRKVRTNRMLDEFTRIVLWSRFQLPHYQTGARSKCSNHTWINLIHSQRNSWYHLSIDASWGLVKHCLESRKRDSGPLHAEYKSSVFASFGHHYRVIVDPVSVLRTEDHWFTSLVVSQDQKAVDGTVNIVALKSAHRINDNGGVPESRIAVTLFEIGPVTPTWPRPRNSLCQFKPSIVSKKGDGQTPFSPNPDPAATELRIASPIAATLTTVAGLSIDGIDPSVAMVCLPPPADDQVNKGRFAGKDEVHCRQIVPPKSTDAEIEELPTAVRTTVSISNTESCMVDFTCALLVINLEVFRSCLQTAEFFTSNGKKLQAFCVAVRHTDLLLIPPTTAYHRNSRRNLQLLHEIAQNARRCLHDTAVRTQLTHTSKAQLGWRKA
ncbi:hypothetical protein CLF_106741 [Clonorchis sinensis]|uniref:Uncharacterized protein n=1 Tax=Clonorchis sinensis TaxID=79923 RepID=G7YFM3_CLOSI|nr:hypothetical protein CLF_106741 [Clonorchis sinensis]